MPVQVVEERGLQKHPSWLNKCIQLYETYLVRHGIMVVGPSGSGKSAIIDCLAAALSELGNKTVVWRMNPKAITAAQMFGRMDAATGTEWRPCLSWDGRVFGRDWCHTHFPLGLLQATGPTASLRCCGAAPPRPRTRAPGSCWTAPWTPSGSRTSTRSALGCLSPKHV